MGRPERPLDPSAGPVQRLAHELRELRKAAGSPSYRAMAQAVDFSAATLSQAAGGERLPSSAVVQAYARACGADPAEWEPRWKAAEAETALARGADGLAPYRGLAPFGPDDHELFFGRDRLIGEVRELVRGHRFAVVFGPSGSGKSSLLRAGLVPRLRDEIENLDHPATLRIVTPGAQPATTHGRLLAPAAGEPETWLVVDQFEEVFTLCRDRAERVRFIDLLLSAREPDSRLRVIVAVRADFYARCAEHRGLADALRGSGLLVGAMTADELRETVVKPAQAAGLLVERELTARIVAEVLDRPGALPMLSHALLETWRRRWGRLLTQGAYDSAGGVSGAIAASAEEAYGRLSAEQKCAARQLLLRLIAPGENTSDTRRPLLGPELQDWTDPSVPSVVERLAEARLLTVDDAGVQLAHEALITCWPRLRDWLEEDRERLRHHRRLTGDTRAWLETGRDPGSLYRGARLARAQEIFADDERADGLNSALTTSEKAFLTAAAEARSAERRTVTRTTRGARLLVTALCAVVAVALIVGQSAWHDRRDSERQRTDTTARGVAATADGMRTTDPRTAMLLGVAAWRISALPETRRALLGSLSQPELDVFTDPAPGDQPQRVLTDSGRTLFSADGRTWRTWDIATHRLTASGRQPDGEVTAVGPDGRVLAVSTDAGVRLWDTRERRWTGAPRPLPSSSRTAFGADGRTYLTSDATDDLVRLRSVADGRVLFETRATGPWNATPSADGRLLAVCAAGRAPQVWQTDSRRALPGSWAQAHGVCRGYDGGLVLGGGTAGRTGGAHATVPETPPDGRLAAVTETGIRVWDLRTNRRIADIDDPGTQYTAFSPDGAFLATLGQEIRVWRLSAPGTPVFRHPLPSQHLSGDLVWDPARPVLRYRDDSTVHSLDLEAAVTSPWRERPLDGTLLSPDGRTLATAERSGTRYRFQLHDTRDGHLSRTLPTVPLPVLRHSARPLKPQDTVPLMAFSPDGTALAYGVSAPDGKPASQRFTVWDLVRGRTRSELDLAAPESFAPVVPLALGPGGRTLYTARASDNTPLGNEVWDTLRHRRTKILAALASTDLAVRPDGGLLVGDDRAARLPAGAVTAHALGQGGTTGALAFSPDGSRLAVGDWTGRVALWDSDLRHSPGLLRNVFPSPFVDGPETVSALAFSPDGHTLAVGGDSGTLQLWDTATRQPLGGPLTTPGEPVDTLAFSPDSGTLYTGSAHVPLQRYTVAPSDAVARICARANAALSRAQWRTRIPDEPYRVLCAPPHTG
ncbi:helix-turn-helix domain-containing protein [Streptomyces sp. NPDC048277]|uniref:nSTAND1 domain-containing NTPase n=1 Tax=Streptomyces sp. NPDC048277 TaxID=3155027 RepID=UPI0033F99A06